MAAHDARAASFRPRKINGVAPHFAIGHFQPYVSVLTGGVHLMTRFAAPPPLRLIDMQVMEILVAVSEVCKGRGDLVMSDILLVTLKT
jgi:hypothetical protein